jgi:hypothetical protein
MNAAYVLLVALPAALISFILEGRRKNEAAASPLPFTWGYFIGMSGLLIGLYCGLAGVFVAFAGEKDRVAGAAALLLLAAVFGPAGYYAMKRRKWAWVMTTIVSCNPAWWIANTVYGTNRWHEFDTGEPQRPQGNTISAPAPI